MPADSAHYYAELAVSSPAVAETIASTHCTYRFHYAKPAANIVSHRLWVAGVVVLVVVIVVDMYSASSSASNAPLLVPLCCEKMSLQSQSEAVCTRSRVPERVWKAVPFHQTCNGERPTTRCRKYFR